MKKFFLFFALMIGMITASNAQSGFAYTFPRILGDSLITADTVHKTISITSGYTSLGIQVNIKKGTGTLDGKVYLFTSLDGVTYQKTDSASWVTVPTMTGITSTTYTSSAQITKSYPFGVKYLVIVTQAGSLTSSPVQVQYTARK